ncbi:non-ribosomal peptide synthase/polyketide synthase [Paraliomyxa miuraensis]|uniref:non-ribosomal peptide synthase/polyketide synthase n=1 Tax=Paraliomyxa miuraensis TaxID=376150 RepID=UPI00224E05B6|nr:non-ribosomal peptide synthase/polyketide synthase [Paraliomyxa miuraensis]MCX4243039.1 non-ribosomal peptide synthase/polyketide synthase [Paraliomyxa miuraensis]
MRSTPQISTPWSSLVDVLRARANAQPDRLAYTFLVDGEGDELRLTLGELEARARSVAALLQERGLAGERVLLLFPPGLDFIVAFLGCLLASVTAVPAYPPDPRRLPRELTRLRAIAADARPRAALTTTALLRTAQTVAASQPDLVSFPWLATDDLPADQARAWEEPRLGPDSSSLLQYTSGSTANPKGVMLSHGNLLANLALIESTFGCTACSRMVSWLPPYHDMGLIGGILEPLYAGFPAVLMSPASFLQRPARWLQAISRFQVTTSGGPNFAFDLCVRKTTPEERDQLDLSSWSVAFNGAEPVRAETLERFSTAFSTCGFRREALLPCYGLAESTLLVSGPLDRSNRPVVRTVSADALADGRMLPAAGREPQARLVGCGRQLPGHTIEIVDPETGERRPPGRIGEIWVSGASVASGYFNRPEESDATFGARLPGAGDATFLRTGDLGIIEEGEIYVCGRLRDLIIIRGRNHHPHDIERSFEAAHPALRPGCCAAFALDVEGRECLVIVAEVDQRRASVGGSTDWDAVVAAGRAAVAEAHGLQTLAVALLRPRTIPKTSSGKLQRRACRLGFVAGTLEEVFRSAFPPAATTPHLPSPDAHTLSRAALLALPRQLRQDRIVEHLTGHIAETLGLGSAERIDTRRPLHEYGLDSQGAVELSALLAEAIEAPVSETAAFDYPHIEALADHIVSRLDPPEPQAPPLVSLRGDTAPVHEPIAIIGIGCRFPGGANEPERLWDLLVNGRDAIVEVPPERWNADEYYDPEPGVAGKIANRCGGFVDDALRFDAAFFGIGPREAMNMDPQQRLLLEVAWEALERAGYPAPRLMGSPTGVFVGASSFDHGLLTARSTGSAGSTPYTATGSALSVAAGRISYALGLCGPSLIVDTACSSSLVATYMAAQSLWARDCDLALAGGVNLMLTPEPSVYLSQIRALSPTGRCRPFAASADGYVRSEGCGMLVLKRLSDAERDHDDILAVLLGGAVNQDGRSNGLTAPNGESQRQMLRLATARAAVEPATIDYVEVHGSGTPLGDPIEAESLAAVLCDERSEHRPLLLGAIKSNIGHTEAAAGVAGLIKTVLALRHGVIPPTLHLDALNPRIRWADVPLCVPTETTTWARADTPRRAGVSAFGFSGTNAHLVLQERPASGPRETNIERPLHVVTLSARSQAALREQARRYASFLEDHFEGSLADLAHTTICRRTHFDQRLALVTGDRDHLTGALRALADGDGRQRRPVAGGASSRSARRIGFLFTGQGSQYPGMGRELYETQPVFADVLNRCDALLRGRLEHSLLEVMFAEPSRAVSFHETAYTQMALFGLQAGLAALWRSWGVQPEVMLGHSFGELAAAHEAGVFSLEDALTLIYERGRLMESLPDGGAMAAVCAELERVESAVEPHAGLVSIACHNGPRNYVISGARASVEAVCSRLQADGATTCRLLVSHATHSPLVTPMLDELGRVAQAITHRPPERALISSVSGRRADREIASPEYWQRQIRDEVCFSRGMVALAETGVDAVIEIGPHPLLLGLVTENVGARIGLRLPSMRQRSGETEVMLESLASLYEAGVEIDWAAFDAPFSRRCVQLPTYVFERRALEPPTRSTAVVLADPVDKDPRTAHAPTGSAPPPQQERVEPGQGPAAADVTTRPKHVDRRARIAADLRERIGGLLLLGADEVGDQVPFLEMGADSLVLISALQMIEHRYAVKIPVRRLFDELPNIEALSAYLDENAPPGAVSAPRAAEPEGPGRCNRPGMGCGDGIDTPAASQPKSGSGSTVDGTVARIVEHQLRLMSEQLKLLGHHADDDETARAQVVVEAKQPVIPDPSTLRAAGRGRSTAPSAGSTPRQRQHIEALIERYTRKTAGSKRHTQRHRRHFADNRAVAGFRFSTKEMLYPIVATRAAGSRIWDVDGNEYIDLTMGFGTYLFGHAPPFVVEAQKRQLDELAQVGPHTLLAGECAELLGELTGKERVSFTNSGTEAVMQALRIARTASGRDKVVMFADSYHGHFDGTLALPALSGEQRGRPMAPGITQGMIDDVWVLEYGSPAALEMIEARGDELAAVLVEPVQGRRPDLQPRRFLHDLRRLTHDCGAKLIFDEMITGFRSHLRGAQGVFGVDADLAVYGKVLAGGTPMAAVAGTAALMDHIDGGFWAYGDDSHPTVETTWIAGTFRHHPLCLAAMKATLTAIRDQSPHLQQELNQRTEQMAAELNGYFEDESVPIRVVHFASLFRFEFASNLDLLFFHLLDKGIYIWEGRNCFVSTAHTAADLETFVRAVKETVAELREGGFLPPPPTGGHGGPRGGQGDSRPEPATASLGGNAARTEALTSSVPLTEAQRQLWALAQLGDEVSRAYNVPLALRLRGPLDVEALRQAINDTVNRHEALRSTVLGDGAAQRVAPPAAVDIPVVDLTTEPDDERERRVTEWLEHQRSATIDLTRGPLFRVGLIAVGREEHVLGLVAHHIAIDGLSLAVVAEEIAAAYVARRNREPPREDAPLQFREHVRWLERAHEDPVMQTHEQYWLERLAGPLPILDLPSGGSRPPVMSHRGGHIDVTIGAELTTRLERLGRKHHCTLFMTLVAAYTLWLHRLTGQDDIIVGVPLAGRGLPGSEGLVGYCVNLVPLRSRLAATETFTDHLTAIRNELLDAFEHGDYPFARLIKRLNPPRDASRPLVVQTTFNMDRITSVPEMGEIDVTLEPTPTSYEKYDLSTNVIAVDDELRVEVGFNADLFDAATIRRFVGHFETLLDVIVEEPEVPASGLSLLSDDEARELLAISTGRESLAPDVRCAHEMFAEQAQRTPDATAVLFEGTSLTYRELDRRSSQLSHYLQELGVGPEVLVGLGVDRSLETAVGILGILKAGGVCVPLDPSYPDERLAFMIADARVQILLTQQALLDRVPTCDATKVCLDADWGEIAKRPATSPTVTLEPDNAAYVIYTSGSTGTPKAACNRHISLSNLIHASQHSYRLQPQDRVLHKAPSGFDVAMWELTWPLATGATLVIARPGGHRDPEYLRQVICEHQVSVVHFVPSMLEPFLELPSVSECRSLRVVQSGGEELGAALRDRFHAALDCDLYNAYGPAETAVDASTHCCADNSGTFVPIGRPIDGACLRVVDESLTLLPVGVAGELCISGTVLGRGYLGKPALTAERFIPDPFSLEPGARMYRTGDRVRWLEDGNLQFLGRRDHQVKVRGFRIELGEIEATISRLPGVSRCVVVVHQQAEGPKQLVAYLVANGSSVSGAELRAKLGKSLPDYMVPSAFVVLDALPLSPNGKVDRKALPAPSERPVTGPHLAPRNETELELAQIWAGVLGLDLDRVGVLDNFFELGGDSILSIQVASRARQAGLPLTARHLLEHQTVASQAAIAARPGLAPVQQQCEAGEVPLTPIQRWFFEQDLANPNHWNQTVLLAPREPIAPDRLRRALQAVCDAHDGLRLRFHHDADGWRQEYGAPAKTVHLTTIELGDLPVEERDEALERHANELQASLSLADGPLVRASLVDLGRQRGQRLLLAIHHLVVDGASWRILLDELEVALRQLDRGSAVRVGPRTSSFKRWAERICAHVESGALDGEATYWRRVGANPTCELPVDHDQGPCTEATTESVMVTLSATETEALLRTSGRAYRTRPEELLLAALVKTLASWTGRQDVVIGLEGHGRAPLADDLDLSRTLGWFTTMAPVCLRARLGAGPEELLKATKEAIRRVPQRGIGYGLLRYLHPDDELRADLARIQPQVVFNYLGQLDALLGSSSLWAPAGECTGRPRHPDARRPHLLSVEAMVIDGELRITWEASRNRHRRSTIERLASQHGQTLRELLQHCLSPSARGYTPTDFPLAGLDQAAIDHHLGARPEIEALYPLSPMQAGMLFHRLYAPESTMYINQTAIVFRAGVNADLLEAALRAVVARHPVLRTSLLWDGLERPLQCVQRRVSVSMERHVLREGSTEDEAAWLDAFTRQDREHGLALDEAPLMRFSWIELPAGRACLVWCLHHLMMDGWSSGLVMADLKQAYTALARDLTPSFAAAIPYEPYIGWLLGQDRSAAEEFWRARLAGFEPPVTIPFARSNAAPPSEPNAATSRRTELSKDTTARLQALARQCRVTITTVIQAAWAILWSRYHDTTDVVFGITTAGRSAEIEGIEDMVGLFINTVPLRLRVDPHARLADWLVEVHERQLETTPFEHTPLSDIHRWCEPLAGRSLFDSVLVVENYPIDAALGEDAGPLPVERVDVYEETNYPLTLTVVPGERLSLRLIHPSGMFEAEAMDRILGHLRVALEGMAEDPERTLGERPLLTSAQRHQLLVEWNDTAAEHPARGCAHELLEASAQRAPDSLAAACGRERLTYEELNHRANRMARALVARGVGTEHVVAVLSERGLDLLTTLLAIMKAGGAYLPLDPRHPASRHLQVLSESGAGLVLTSESLAARLQDPLGRPEMTAQHVCIESLLAEQWDEGNLGPRVGGRNLAYVIFTSGSTGVPKGAMVEHAGMVNHLWAKVQTLGLSESDVVAQNASQCFDISIWQMLVASLVGGRVEILVDEVASDPARLLAEAAARRVTVLEVVPSLLRAMLAEPSDELRRDASSLRWLVPTGEALPIDLVRRWFDRHPQIPLVNAYGPTECSDDVTQHPMLTPPPGSTRVPIGRPLANTRLYVLDGALEPQPVGLAGELYVAGAGVGRGYLGRPGLTAASFVPDPFADEPGARMYRTGDLCRHLESGVLEFLGRVDHQVKIRGFRIELGEIEAALMAIRRVSACVVTAHQRDDGPATLVAYLVLERDAELDGAELRQALRERLPEYMVPSTFVVLEALPLGPNGKIDRKALPAPSGHSTETAEAHGAPQTPHEELICSIMAQVLGLDRIGVHDSFFDLGGHSLLATRLVARLRAALEVDLALSVVFEAPSAAELVQRLTTSLAEGSLPRATPITPVSREQELPLSHAQQRLWFLDQLEPSSPLYNLAGLLRLHGPLDARALQEVLSELVRRHEVLRTTFEAPEGRALQCIHAPQAVAMGRVDLRHLSGVALDAELERRAAEEARRPFDLARGPLLRTVLAQLADDEHALMITMHHIVSDGWSQSVMLRDLAVLYEAIAKHEPSPLPELPVQYADFAVWQRDWLAQGELEEQLAYWKGELADLPRLELPTDRLRPAARSHHGRSLEVHLELGLTEALVSLSRRHDSTLFMTLLAAWQVLLGRYSGQTDVAVGTPIANRSHRELEGLIGLFVNTLVLRADLSGTPSFVELLRQVRARALRAYAHQDVPFERVVDELRVERDLGRNALFDVMFSLQDASTSGVRIGGLETELSTTEINLARFDLTLVVSPTPDGLRGVVEYSTELFDASSMERLWNNFRTLLQGIVSNPERCVWDLPLLSSEERRRVLTEWNDTAAKVPEGECVHELFAERARRTPEATAVVLGDAAVTYRELDLRSNQLAHRLRSLGVGPEVLVGLCVERSIELVVGLLGVLKAGGAYVPLDPTYPEDRLAVMIENAQIRVMLTQESQLARWRGQRFSTVCLDAASDLLDGQPQEPVISQALPDNVAYVIYTSGSTGAPKGVQATHRGLCNLVEAQRLLFELGPGDRVLQFASSSFDASIWEVVMALCNGARLHLCARGPSPSGPELAELLRDAQITHATLPPSVLAALAYDEVASPHTLIVAGEACSGDLAARWARERSFFNAYGPAEITVCATAARIVDAGPRPPIGPPIANSQCYVLDPSLAPVPIGVAGELHVAGAGVTRGYLGQPGLTGERFVPNPFTDEPGARMYRTGDRCRWLADGNLEFLGRLDHQVKVRGFRIEPGEIEAALGALEQVSQCVVVARETAPDHRQLVAYVELAAEATATSAELRRALERSLPYYMVPSRFVVLEALPLSPNGKIDRKALPAPDRQPEVETDHVAPRTDIELRLASIWAEVLGLETIGRHDNFFDLGGDSILSIRVVSKARAAGLALTARELFENQTIARQAAVLTGRRPEAMPPGSEAGDVPPTPGQIWWSEQGLTTPRDSSQAVVLAPSLRIAPQRLQRALRALCEYHDALSLCLRRDGAGWRFAEGHAQDVPLTTVDVGGLPPDAQDRALARCASSLQAAPYRADAPLLRATLVELGPARGQRLLLAIHGLVVDDASWRVVLEDLGHALRQLEQTGTIELPPRTTTLRRWSERLRAHLSEGRFDAEVAYWLEASANARATRALPVDHGTRGNAAMRKLVAQSRMDTEALLNAAGGPAGAKPGELVLAALAKTLAEWTGEDATWIELETPGREPLDDDIELSRTVGRLTAPHPVRLPARAERPAALVLATMEALRQVPRNGIGYALLRYLHPDARVREDLAVIAPQVAFRYLDPLVGPADRNGPWSAVEPCDQLDRDAPRTHALVVSAQVVGDELEITWSYDGSRVQQNTVRELSARLDASLRELLQDLAADGRSGVLGASQASAHSEPQSWLGSPVVHMKPGSRAPLFCVHPLWGVVDGLWNLAQCLDGQRPFVALRARGLERGEQPLRSIESMARYYLAAVRRVRSTGPYLLGGWSFGGAVAYEMARQLHDACEEVAALVMLDFSFAGWHGAGAEDGRDPFYALADLLRDFAELGDAAPVDVGSTMTRLRGLGIHAATRQVAGRLGAMGLGLDEAAAIGMVQRALAISEAHREAAEGYEVRPLPVPVTLIRPHDSITAHPGAAGELGASVPSVEVRAVPGGHVSMMRKPHVAEVGRVLDDVLERADPAPRDRRRKDR